jgi:predicted outer membrane repeat protein
MVIPYSHHEKRIAMQINRSDRHLRRLIPLACAIVIATALYTPPANAAGVVGTGTPASCTRAAFNTALVGGGVVTFNCGPNPHTITITLAKSISVDTAIRGGGRITLKASGTHHFKVLSGKTLVLESIRLTEGTSADKGGAIVNQGTLIVRKSSFTNNRAVKGGGAIWSDGSAASVTDSQFDQNQVSDGSGPTGGGAIGNGAGMLTVSNCTFTDNISASIGGALYNGNTGANATVGFSTFFGNEAFNLGGAIYNGGTTTVDRSTLSGNQAGVGGGIAHQGTLLTLTASTLDGNAAIENGGGIYASGNASYTNNTLSGNQAANGGGGLFQNRGDGVMLFTTVANNFAVFGAGVYKEGSVTGTLSLQNTLLSNNTAGNCDGVVASLGHNLSSDTNCAFFTQPGDQTNVDAKIGPLASNGGPTRTHLPQAGSPAIDAAVMAGGITTDQRGLLRPKGAQPDIGSVEVQ